MDKLRNWEMVITVWQLVYTSVPLLIIAGVTCILLSKCMNPKPAQHDNKGWGSEPSHGLRLYYLNEGAAVNSY